MNELQRKNPIPIPFQESFNKAVDPFNTTSRQQNMNSNVTKGISNYFTGRNFSTISQKQLKTNPGMKLPELSSSSSDNNLQLIFNRKLEPIPKVISGGKMNK